MLKLRDGAPSCCSVHVHRRPLAYYAFIKIGLTLELRHLLLYYISRES